MDGHRWSPEPPESIWWVQNDSGGYLVIMNVKCHQCAFKRPTGAHDILSDIRWGVDTGSLNFRGNKGMTVVNFCGNTDKKILTLLLAKAFSVLGDTLLITDDTSYRYCMKEDGYIGGVQVLIRSVEEVELDMHVRYDDGVDYQYIIYDTVDKVDKVVDRTVVVRGKDRSLLPKLVQSVADEVDNSETETYIKEVVITAFYNALELRKLHYLDRGEDVPGKASLIALKLAHYRWISMVQETKELVKFSDRATTSVIAGLVSDIVKAAGKDLETLMQQDK